MSEETPETVEETGEKSPEQSFAELRAKFEAAQAELRPLKAKDAVTAAGFNPDSPEGKALHRLALAEENADAESVKNLAVELGFEASTQDTPKHEPTPNERAAQEFANRASELNQVTQPDEPPDLDTQIAEAERAALSGEGDWMSAINLKLQKFSQ